MALIGEHGNLLENVTGGGGDSFYSKEYSFAVTFDGGAGTGAAGAITVPSLIVGNGYFYEEVFVEVVSTLTTTGGDPFFTLGFTGNDSVGLNSTTGNVALLNSDVNTKISLASFVLSNSDSNVVTLNVTGADITSGEIKVLIRLTNYDIASNFGGGEGGSQSWQDTLIVGSALSQSNTIDNAGNTFVINSGDNTFVGAASQLNISTGAVFTYVQSDAAHVGSLQASPTLSQMRVYNSIGAIGWQIDASDDGVLPKLMLSGQSTGAGYVLTDVVGNGVLTLEPVSGGSTPNLQQVTDVGNTTTNDIVVTTANGFSAVANGTGQTAALKVDSIEATGFLSMSADNSKIAGLYPRNLTTSRSLELPDGNGTLALSVNGNFADSTGNIPANWQSTLIAGSTLTQNNTIDNGIYALSINSGDNTFVGAYSQLGINTGNIYTATQTDASHNSLIQNTPTQVALSNTNASGTLSLYLDGTVDGNLPRLLLGGQSTGAGYVLTDVAGDGSLSLQPAAGGGVSNYTHTIFTPTTGGTVALTNNQYNIINPAGALLALTVNLPSSPANNDVVYIKFTQNVTTVTYGNGTVVDGVTAPTAGGLTVLTYDSGTTSWY